MAIRTSLPAAALALAISTCLLTACGGGGSNVRSVAPSSLPPDPPPPPPPPAEACQAPVTADCVVDISSSQDMTGGRQSDFALVKRGTGELTLIRVSNVFDNSPIVDFRFGAGTTVEDGDLRVASNANLLSNVTVQANGQLQVGGSVTGDVANHGVTTLDGTVTGDMANDGVLEPGSSIYGDVVPAHVEGNFTQASNGTLIAVTPMTAYGPMDGGFVSVTGRADIAGTLELRTYSDDYGPYPLPTTPLSMQVLHADGGVFGQFAQWTSPGLFITGSVRYLANDVYFDASAISVAPAMAAAKAGDALTLQSATRFDAALGNANGLASATISLTHAQRQFLASAGTIQRLRTWDQAIRTFDSLSGSGYTAAVDALMQQASMPAADLMSRMDNVQAGWKPGAWSGSAAMPASGTGRFAENRAGFDGWLADGVLLGGSLGWSDGSLRFDRFGGTAQDRSPQWDVYLRRDLSAGAYVFGDIGYGHHQVNFHRRIDLGVMEQAASAMRTLDVTRGYLEAGRDFRVGQARLTPFGAISHVVLQGGGFAEQGGTGFELIAQPATYRQTGAAAGLRLGRDWRDGERWTALNLSMGYRQILAAHDDARAAFAGVPDLAFALDGLPHRQSIGWLHANLATGNAHWNWLLSYDRQASDEALSLGANFRF
jgi:uncharacterized protein with beta-barrel porin domain